MIIATDQGFINEKHRRVAQIVNDYDRNLEVQWIPNSERASLEEKAKPFRIIHNGQGAADGKPYVVMNLTEQEMDGRVIEKLFQMRVDKHDIPAMNRAQMDARKVLKFREEEDERLAKADFDVFRLKTPLHTFKHNGEVYRT